MAEESEQQQPMHRKLARELKTVKTMIGIYCRDKHATGTSGLCEDCQQLSVYAEKRLAGCPFQQDKPTCGKCAIHCYKPDMKQRIIEVMRHSGPRMILHHPFLAIVHLFDEKFCGSSKNSQNKTSSQKSGEQQS